MARTRRKQLRALNQAIGRVQVSIERVLRENDSLESALQYWKQKYFSLLADFHKLQEKQKGQET